MSCTMFDDLYLISMCDRCSRIHAKRIGSDLGYQCKQKEREVQI